MANDEISLTSSATGKEIAIPSTSTDPSKVNISNPYFTHHSDHPGLVLISKPLTGDNFSTWKRAMTLALNSKNKLGFVNGSIKAPSEETDPESYAAWSQCNDMVHSWIINTLSPEISDIVIYYSAAHEQDIAYLRQEQLSISGYYTKLKGLWDELASYNDAVHGTQQEQQKLMQFLMGLNDSYSAVRGQILLMNPLPSVRQAYSSVSQKEKYAAMAVRSNNSGSKSASARFERSNRSYGSQDFRLQEKSLENQSGGRQDRRRFGSGRGRPNCSHCGEMGHWVQTCYELHGYPADHPKAKHNSGSNSGPRHFNNNNKTTANHVSEALSKVDGNHMVGISEAQLQQLLSLLDNKNEGSSSQANAVTKSGSGYEEDDWFG
ncbi:hypothetical protein ACOSP7_010025 [Xanthoceras sorbifolium]